MVHVEVMQLDNCHACSSTTCGTRGVSHVRLFNNVGKTERDLSPLSYLHHLKFETAADMVRKRNSSFGRIGKWNGKGDEENASDPSATQ